MWNSSLAYDFREQMVFGTLRTGIEISFPQTEIDIKILSLPLDGVRWLVHKSTKIQNMKWARRFWQDLLTCLFANCDHPVQNSSISVIASLLQENTPNLMSIAPKQGTNKGTSICYFVVEHLILSFKMYISAWNICFVNLKQLLLLLYWFQKFLTWWVISFSLYFLDQ